jgi:cytochrome c peroxidase
MSAKNEGPMSRLRYLLPTVASVGLALSSVGCNEPDETRSLTEAIQRELIKTAKAAEKPRRDDVNPRLLRRFQSVRTQIETPDNAITTAKVDLGRMLYFEKRLSKNHDVSCNTCHQLDKGGVDNLPTSTGHKGQKGGRNSPTVYNAAGLFAQFWDGRAETVEQQAVGPILNPIEMALPSAEKAVEVLSSMPEYKTAFAAAFPRDKDPVSFVNVGRAIGAFERKLTTPARWDDYLRGSADALTEKEIDGLKIFTNIGCMVCHTGEFVGGAMYQKVGVVEPWPNQKDQGRFEVTKQEVDRMMFKVPTLRNIRETAPYFHDGSAATLDQAVRMMGKHQLGLNLEEREVSAIVEWLGSLSGRIPLDYIKPPTLPPSTEKTPKPDPT